MLITEETDPLIAAEAMVSVLKEQITQFEEMIRVRDATIQKLRELDTEASDYVESVICMRTHFTGDPPYVGWKGLGLALNEALDEQVEAEKAFRHLYSMFNFGSLISDKTAQQYCETALVAIQNTYPELLARTESMSVSS